MLKNTKIFFNNIFFLINSNIKLLHLLGIGTVICGQYYAWNIGLGESSRFNFSCVC